MLNRILEFSLANRFLVIIIALVVVGIGIRSMFKLPIDAVPDADGNIEVPVMTDASRIKINFIPEVNETISVGPISVKACAEPGRCI